MIRFRSWRLVGSAVGVAALAAACSVTGSSSAGPTQNASDGEFVVYSADAPNVKATQDMLQADFGNPNKVTIKMVAYPASDFITQFQNAVRSGSEVDGLILNGQHVGFLQSKGLLKPIDDVVDPSTLQPQAIDPFKIDGKLYAAGIGTLNTSMVAYNKDIMTKYNLVVPKTFDDIKNNVAKLKGSGISLFGFGGATTFQWPLWFMQMFQQTSGDKPVETTKKTLAGQSPSFTDAPYVEAMRHLQELGASGAFQPGLMGTANTAAQADFLAGKSAMYYYGSWVISNFVSSAKFPVDVAQFPAFVSGATPRPTGGVTGATGIFNNTPANKTDLARKFVQFLTSVQGDQKVLKTTPQGFVLPATKGVPMEKQTPLEATVQTDFGLRSFGFLDWLWPASVTTAFQQNIQAVVGQQKSPEAAMADIDKAFKAG